MKKIFLQSLIISIVYLIIQYISTLDKRQELLEYRMEHGGYGERMMTLHMSIESFFLFILVFTILGTRYWIKQRKIEKEIKDKYIESKKNNT